jgi:hypothetical protein
MKQKSMSKMSLHFDTLSQFRVNQSLLLLFKHDVCLEEKHQIPIDLTPRGLEPTIYRTRGKCTALEAIVLTITIMKRFS